MYNILLNKDIYNQKLKISLITVKLNNNGFADLLSSNLELYNDLKYAKNKINQINAFQWDDLKKYTNPYELIYAFNNRASNGNSYGLEHEYECSVANIKPLSRSFFKMIEMINEFAPELTTNKCALVTLHICEGPGGFIEAMRYLRKAIDCNDDISFGITLASYDDKKSVPAWKQTGFFLRNNPNVIITYGSDGTGNIYNTNNINYV
jgi:hypothetical protein